MGLANPGEELRTVELFINNYTIPFPGNNGKRTQYTTFAWNFPDDSADLFHVIFADAIVKTKKNLHHYVVNGCPTKWPADKVGYEALAGTLCVTNTICYGAYDVRIIDFHINIHCVQDRSIR